MKNEELYEQASPGNILAWFSWPISGCDGIVISLFFDDDCVPEPEGAEWLEQEG